MDALIRSIDTALRTLTGTSRALREMPAANEATSAPLSERERRHAAGLMRVNHCGEVCAQALYSGAAAVARDPEVVEHLEAAGQEEVDHLVWCAERLQALDSRPSLLNPAFYAASWGIGAISGLIDDKLSLGFVEATEEQVVEHLEKHLDVLPEQDHESRAVLAQMREDEARHELEAVAAGATRLPSWQRNLMRRLARVMTTTTYRV
ncbi:MAG: 2-polyprenyl-3-methyl-6-methoxy-1,4-benzoquinone monooxygenase [Pseudomonadota bacterium]